MKTGIIFDLDGTLLDTLEDLTDATNYTLACFGCPPRRIEELRRFVGNGALQQMRLSLPGKEDDPDLTEVLAVYKSYYHAHSQIKTKPYAGILDALAQLGKKYPLAIVSNKPDATVKELCAHYFPGVYALGENPTCPRKPSPEMVFRAMADIGVEQCIYVGDSEVDVATSKNAGVPCLSVLWGFRDQDLLEASGASHFCSAVELLPGAIEDMMKEKCGYGK